MVSGQINPILLSGGKELLFQLVNLTVQLLDVSCLGDALVNFRPVAKQSGQLQHSKEQHLS